MVINPDWFAGFVDGEGSFEIQSHGGRLRPRFRLVVRNDDSAVIRAIHKFLGVGVVFHKKWSKGASSKWRPQIGIDVGGHKCARLVEVLDEHPLRAKKAQDYKIRAEAVRFFCSARMSRWISEEIRNARHEKLARYKEQLSRVREYMPP